MAYTARRLIHDVKSVPPEATCADAARVMRDADIGAVIVAQPGSKKAEGIFTERDLCRRVVASGADPSKAKVRDHMTRELTTVDAADPLDEVFETLAAGKFRHVPITDGGEIVGIVSLTDLAKVLRLVYKEEKYLQYFADTVQRR
jgi:CBS domain-containing protein